MLLVHLCYVCSCHVLCRAPQSWSKASEVAVNLLGLQPLRALGAAELAWRTIRARKRILDPLRVNKKLASPVSRDHPVCSFIITGSLIDIQLQLWAPFSVLPIRYGWHMPQSLAATCAWFCLQPQNNGICFVPSDPCCFASYLWRNPSLGLQQQLVQIDEQLAQIKLMKPAKRKAALRRLLFECPVVKLSSVFSAIWWSFISSDLFQIPRFLDFCKQ